MPQQSTGGEPRPGGRPRDRRADTYLKSMLLGLIEDSYLHTGTFTQFAAEVLQVIAYAVTVPVAFTEGFLRAYLSIERVEEDEDGRIKIVPKQDAELEDMIRDVDELTAQVDPGAVFNPVVRARLDTVHEVSSKAMKWDINTLSRMSDEELMQVLREMQAESEAVVAGDEPDDGEATDYVRARLATIRRNVRRYQVRQGMIAAAHGGEAGGAGEGHAAAAQEGGAPGGPQAPGGAAGDGTAAARPAPG